MQAVDRQCISNHMGVDYMFVKLYCLVMNLVCATDTTVIICNAPPCVCLLTYFGFTVCFIRLAAIFSSRDGVTCACGLLVPIRRDEELIISIHLLVRTC